MVKAYKGGASLSRSRQVTTVHATFPAFTSNPSHANPYELTMSSFFQPAPAPATELGRYHVLSSTAGVRVSPLCLGGMSIGEAWSSVMGVMNKENSFKLLDAFFDAGGNFIDTANSYQNEQSELWIGEWMAERGNRDQIVLATKYTSDFRSYAIGKGKGPNFAGNQRKSLHMSARDSLKKLQTDYIDILYVHWWDYTTSIKELMDSLHILVEQGKVLYLGASDTPAWVVSAANTYAVDHGKTPFSIYQGRWSLMHRDFEREIIPMARIFGMALAPWDVLGGGKFQSKKALEERKAKGEGLRSFTSAAVQNEEEVKLSEALYKVAQEHGIESVTAIALSYVRSKAANVFPIIGGRKVEHLHDNIQALSIKLTDEQINYLENVRPFDIGFPSNFLVEDPNVTGKSKRLEQTAPMAFPNHRK
ncbi:aldo/keto reductase [Podospora didyma]|uniref:Aldo-keto reductase ausK n=1 Tax=Podospora didyma TaxID=330526 RepID=A0AAE0NCS8_9PEZI|nr:aldo/keto reductase [Podospora didyma]